MWICAEIFGVQALDFITPHEETLHSGDNNFPSLGNADSGCACENGLWTAAAIAARGCTCCSISLSGGQCGSNRAKHWQLSLHHHHVKDAGCNGRNSYKRAARDLSWIRGVVKDCHNFALKWITAVMRNNEAILHLWLVSECLTNTLSSTHVA